METKLVNHGIQNESSDVRVHVCAGIRRVYVFPTRYAKDAAENHLKDAYFAYQPGVHGPTATGVRVQPQDIRGCVSLEINDAVWEWANFKSSDDTSAKGAKAQSIVMAMLKRGMIPLPVASSEAITDLELQVSGTDILVRQGGRAVRVQVKCDIPGGARGLGGRGLFLQLSERNPLRKF
jgi:hypothetical protein